VSHVTNERMRETRRGACYLTPNASTRGANAAGRKFSETEQITVSNKETQAREVLDRFASQMWVVDSVLRSFDLPAYYRDEVEQEARVLLISYADLFDTPVWGHGDLTKMETLAKGQETEIKSLVARQLRINLSQIIARQITRDGVFRMDSLEEMQEDGYEPSDEGKQENTTVDDLDNGQENDRLHRLFPTLARNVLDNMTQAEIAEADGVGHATVERRIAREKEAFKADQERSRLIAQIQEAGLHTNGSETLAELQEAAEYLKKRIQ
jgi:hypothetical protein